MTGYYRMFMKGYLEIAKPLPNLTNKEVKLIWANEKETAFNNHKKCLDTALIMGYPDPIKPFILDTDAYGCSIGVLQTNDRTERVRTYVSRVLSKEKQNYCVTRRDFLAIVYFINHYRHYLKASSCSFRLAITHSIKFLFYTNLINKHLMVISLI